MHQQAMSFRKAASRSIAGLIGGMALLVVLPGLSACSSTSRTENPLRPAGQRPASSDSYPDFSKPLTSAMAQMSDEEAARMSAQLTALGSQRRAGQISEAEYWRRVKEMRGLADAP